MSSTIKALIAELPKAELHLHIEGTLEPELAFELAQRNDVDLGFGSVDALRAAYRFDDLQSFLDLYYSCCSVLLTERDFAEMTYAYLERAAADRVVHAEIFFDPQTHTARGVGFDTVITGICVALERARAELGISSRLIMCFLRHLSEDEAFATLEQAGPHRERIAAVGLDSSEVGHPPSKFERVFAAAREQGLKAVAHAGEEGPPSYISEALDLLRVERVDHGVACEQDEELVARLVAEQTPLTVCPLSNLALKVVADLREHNLARLLGRGLCVTVNSDDPAYFGGYVGDNYEAVVDALGIGASDVVTLAENSIRASFLDDDDKQRWLGEIARVAAAHR